MQQKFCRARPAPALRRRPERERPLVPERRARARRADPSLRAAQRARRQLLAKETRLVHPSWHDEAFGQRPLESRSAGNRARRRPAARRGDFSRARGRAPSRSSRRQGPASDNRSPPRAARAAAPRAPARPGSATAARSRRAARRHAPRAPGRAREDARRAASRRSSGNAPARNRRRAAFRARKHRPAIRRR